MMSSDRSIECVLDENFEGEMYVTEYGIIQGTDGEVLGSTHGSVRVRVGVRVRFRTLTDPDMLPCNITVKT